MLDLRMPLVGGLGVPAAAPSRTELCFKPLWIEDLVGFTRTLVKVTP